VVVDMAYRLDTLDGMGSVLASSAESTQDKNIGKAEMASGFNSLGNFHDLTVRLIWLSSTS